LPVESRLGAEYSTGGNPANTFDVRPGHIYTLSQDLVDPDSPIAYRQVRLERLTGTTWTPVSSTAVPAPAPGQSVIYRFVNAPVTPTTLPITGGAGADAFLLAGGSTLVLALVLAFLQSRHRRRRSAL
jgi:LPXTG-motif cell wall-anchored protein